MKKDGYQTLDGRRKQMEIWTWTVLPSQEVGVARKSDLNGNGEGSFAIFSNMDEAAAYVLDHGGTFVA